jgi:phosphatidylserine decarboxylase
MFHKEGFGIITFSFLMSTSLVISIEILTKAELIKNILQILVLSQFLIILYFFRNPKRNIILDFEKVISPADGKIVAINNVYENEFLNSERIKISIFLSPLDIHVNRYPVSGDIIYNKHHHGDYLVAWHPKSSEKNERTSVVIKNKKFGEILYRQIAGAFARRIVNYAKENSYVKQGDDSGFIKFGSRVDLFLPIDTEVKVKVGDRVVGGISIIA